MPFIPNVNGVEPCWADIEVRLFGRPVAGIQSIDYADPRKFTNILGAGNRPVSRSGGNYEPSAKMGLLLSELFPLQKAAPGGDISRIPEFDIIVSFIPEGSVRQTKHIIHNCRFHGPSLGAKQGDASIAVELEMTISHVTWNA